MAEYLTNTEDLTTVANAIRTKGSTSDSLSFPNGFATAIANIPSGGGIDLDSYHTVTVVNGDTLGSRSLTVNYRTEQMSSISPFHVSGSIILYSGETKTVPKATNFVHIASNYMVGAISFSDTDAVECLATAQGGGYILIYNDVTISIVFSCFLPDTLITLADGTRKPIQDITYADTLLVWDFDKGEFGTAPICWLTRSGLRSGHYYKLTFSDGTVLKTTGEHSNHKIYNVEERYFKGVDKTEIGDRIFGENGIVTVTNKEYIEEDVEYYNLITTGKINCFADGILASDRYGNLYPIDEDMKYVKEGREIRPYSEFEAVGIKRYWYDTLRLGEVTGTVEETRSYISKLECQMLPLPEYDGTEVM